MALQGTIDAFPMVDVLQLLATSHKTGRLELVGDRGRGILWVQDGSLVSASLQGHPLGDAAESIWEMLRFADGSFEFTPDEEPPPARFDPADVMDTVESARVMIEDWTQIERRVPSLGHRVHLASSLPGGEVRLTTDDWSMVVAAGPSPIVNDLLVAVGLEEFQGCRRLAELVDRGLVTVEESHLAALPGEIRSTAASAAQPAAEPTPTPASPTPAPAAATPEVPATGPADDVPTVDEGPQDPVPQDPVSQDPAPQDPVSQDPALQEPVLQDPAPQAFPDHFPIDDLVGDAEPTWADAAPAPEAPPQSAPPHAADTFDSASPPAAAGPAPVADAMGEDDVLAQIGRLSPKAAEAIAAALGDGDAAPGTAS